MHSLLMKPAEQQKRDQAARQAVAEMEAVAAAGGTITYSDLADRITAVAYAPNGRPLAKLLSDISRDTQRRRGVMLSAVVVHKDDGLPGEGFFQVAKALGRDTSDEPNCHREALEEVWRAYAEGDS